MSYEELGKELFAINESFRKIRPNKDILEEIKKQMSEVTLKYFPNEKKFKISLDCFSWQICFCTSDFEMRFDCNTDYLNLDHIKFDKKLWG